MRERRLVLLATLAFAAGCTVKKPTEETYFERTIQPILENSCVSTNTGANCHVGDAQRNAFGNLSLRSYEELAKRRDLLVEYGPYRLPNLLLKNVDPYGLRLIAYDGTPISITTDIRHSGRQTVGLTSAGLSTLKRWIEGGASESNAPTSALPVERDACSEEVPSDPAFDPAHDPTAADYGQFNQEVQPVLGGSCAAGNCHGSPSNSLRLVCAGTSTGNPDVLARWNYFAATQYLATKASDLGSSEILRRPLDPAAGGAYHEGGAIFSSQMDPGFVALLNWANAHGPNTNVPTSKGFDFFAKRVQPMLVKKGCMLLGCHSPAMFHDYRLHAGSSGSFSVPTTLTNYELTRAQIALESPDPTASRLLAKNLERHDEHAGARGIQHRGGPIFDDFPHLLAPEAACDPKAAETGDLDEQHAYCVLSRWIGIEQEEAKLAPLSGVVYVKKKPAPLPDTPQDYATYAGASDLCFTALAMDAKGVVSAPGAGACKSLLAGCAGLSPATADLRHPSVSWKGDQVAFAARSGPNEPYAVWTVHVDGSSCVKQADIEAAPTVPGWSNNGALVHNFDPVFTPDDRIVFASTRGNVMNTAAFDYQGPQRAPADPSKWNANLYIVDGPGKIRQLTFLLNQELLPSMMSDGRLIYTTEKRAPGFYQLAGRRQNLDGGDYHPLFGQRNTIGFDQMTEVVELANKNLAAIFSNRGAAHGAGTLGIINRSLGPDQHSTNPEDYTADQRAITWPEPSFFLHSLCFPPGDCNLPAATMGAYRSPAPLPNGDLLVSYAANVTDVTSFQGNFDLYVLDSATGQPLLQVTNDAATDEIFAAAVYQRFNRGVFKSRLDEPNGHTRVYRDGEDPAHPADRSDVTVLDVPVLGSLLFQNTRTGRPIPDLPTLDVYEDLPPDLTETSLANGSPFVAMDAYGPVYARRRLLGAITPLSDGSARVALPGGVPLVLSGFFALDGQGGDHHFQREEMQFYPGEYAHQSFPRPFFNGMCGGCHGSLSGYEDDLAIAPDILTQASRVAARYAPATDLVSAPMSRGAVIGPPSSLGSVVKGSLILERPTLSLVLPVFNEEAVIPELGRRLAELLGSLGVTWEVIFVNDGSSDRSLELLRQLASTDPRYQVVSFSRNFGHQFAVTAGVDYARGDAVVIMDADLQDPPEVVVEMIAKWRQGFDVVYGVRQTREKESLFKRATAFLFYRLLRAIVGVPIPLDAGDFRLISRKVVLTLRALRETNRFFRGMVAWVGFRQTAVLYARKARFAGETHYPLRRMLGFAFDGIVSFSIVPLRIATFLGGISGLIGVLVAAWAAYDRFYGRVVPGWTTIMIAVALASSAQLLMTGVLGEYIGRIYEEIKRRPLYIVEEEVNARRDESDS